MKRYRLRLLGSDFNPGGRSPSAVRFFGRIRSEDDEELIQSIDSGRADLKDGILAARELKDDVQDERLDVLRRARQVLSLDGHDLAEAGRRAYEAGQEILRAGAYAARFAELRGVLETVETERRGYWDEAREKLQRTADEVRDQAALVLDQVGEAAREEFETQLRTVVVPDDATFADGPVEGGDACPAAELPEPVDDLRAEIGRRQGKEVRRIAVRELFSEPIRNEEELEALLERIRAAAEEVLRDGEYFLLT